MSEECFYKIKKVIKRLRIPRNTAIKIIIFFFMVVDDATLAHLVNRVFPRNCKNIFCEKCVTLECIDLIE